MSDTIVLDRIEFFVAGEPHPKGSTRGFYIKKLDRVVTTNANKDTKTWEIRVAHEAQAAESKRDKAWSLSKEEAYDIGLEFYFQRPQSYPKKWRFEMTVTPDIDKLIRAVLDGLKNVLLFDDSQVISLSVIKEYAGEFVEGKPGVFVHIEKRARRSLR